jgi:heme-degrading monooxygenase HmoA
MFARTVRMQLKPERAAEFTQVIEKEVIPRLRKQQGFHDEIVFLRPGGVEAVRITLWDNKGNADAYQRDAHQEVLRALETIVDGSPRTRSFEVSNSTFHKIAAR